MAFAFEPKTKGDEEKAASAIRRLEEEDPTLDVHRDQQTGEQIIAGLTQIHVEVITDRMKERFGAEIDLHPPRSLSGVDPQGSQGARALQETDRRARPVQGRPHRARTGRARRWAGLHRRDQGRSYPQGVHPSRREGDRRGDAAAPSPATP